MHTKYFFINNGSNRQAVKTISKCFPEFNIIPSLAFIIKAIYSVYTSALMVTSEKKEVFRVFNLVCKKQAHCL